ncbi:MAG: hypothetical protein DSY42_06935 [Aquifex sp.]|nr:MAG: hypothetical protein DSY42_06935 [Aquifex sp.]
MEKIAFKLFFEDKDITRDLSPFLLSLRYTDYASSQDDELEIELSNEDLRFLKSWYPEKGVKVKAFIGYENNLLPCGEFEVEEIEFRSNPETCTIKCISTHVSKKLRTKKTRAWENTTLFQIVNEIAREHGLKPILQGEDIPVRRIDQNQQTDANFLNELAKKFGYNFKVAGDKLVFVEAKSLEESEPVMTIKREGILSYEIADKARKIYRACEVKYFDVQKHKEMTYRYELELPVGDTIRLSERVENLQQAVKKAKAVLRNKNKNKAQIRIELVGNPSLTAGLTIKLQDFGIYDGKHFIEKSEHILGPFEGYKTFLEVRTCLNY